MQTMMTDNMPLRTPSSCIASSHRVASHDMPASSAQDGAQGDGRRSTCRTTGGSGQASQRRAEGVSGTGAGGSGSGAGPSNRRATAKTPRGGFVSGSEALMLPGPHLHPANLAL